MVGPIIAIAAMSAPAGFLAGDVFAHRNKMKGAGWLKYAAAAFLPLAAVLAAVVITQTEIGEDHE